jgi:two-component system chemotaxis response regulator CheB
MHNRDVIVIGGSAGGMDALIRIVRDLPADLPAAVFVVIHTAPYTPSRLPSILGRAGTLPAAHAQDGEPVTPGRIFVAPPDYHLILEPGRVRVAHGPKENRFRPAIDPLFRSAALAYGPRVIGVVLSGLLDDGSAGLWAVKARGGVAIVQDPEDALFRPMPENAMRQTRIDHVLRIADIAPTLAGAAAERDGEPEMFPVPEGMEIETRIAMDDKAMQVGVVDLGEPSLFTCPECHGSLLRIKNGGGLRFRCHTGHAYTADALLAELTESIESVLWTAVRTVQESSLLMGHIAEHVRQSGQQSDLAAKYDRKAADAMRRSELVRDALVGLETLSNEKLADES